MFNTNYRPLRGADIESFLLLRASVTIIMTVVVVIMVVIMVTNRTR